MHGPAHGDPHVFFQLTPELAEVQAKARQFVREECDPLEAQWPLSEYEAPPEQVAHLRRRFTDYGFRGLAIPKDAGGQGLGTLAKCLAFEQLKSSWVLYGNTVLWSAYLDPNPALNDAPAWQQRKYLHPILEGREQYHICISEPDHGSDVAAMTTTAVRDGDHYVINGVKRWSPDPFHPFLKPEYLLVYASTAPGTGYKGISTFLVDFPSDGVEVRDVKETAAAGTFLGRVCDLHFTDCRIPARNLLGREGEGFRYVQDQLNRNRTVIGMGAVGTAQRALDTAVDYAKKRVTFGQRLADQQAIQWMLAESEIDLNMGRLLCYQSAAKIDAGGDARKEAAMVKAFCPQMATRVIDRAIQVLGGVGGLKESRLPEAYFMYRLGMIAEGSVEMMKMTIAKSLLGIGPRETAR